MKKLLITAILSVFAFSSWANDVYVNGYTKSNGSYVEGHYRSAPDSSTSNNWSSQGNTNPYTGEIGTKSYDSNSNDYYGKSINSNSGYKDTKVKPLNYYNN
jgi:hypothetical protein